MTKLHKAEGGVFTRCRATVMQGHGVTDCPLEVDGVEVRHVVGLKGIAEAGGGIMRKPLGTGKLVPELERRRQRRREQREGQLPDLNAMEQWQVDEEYAALKEHVTQGLLHWDVPNVTAQFASDARTASAMAERGVFTPASLALLLEVSNRHNAPLELTYGLKAVKEQITDNPDPRAYLVQKAREEKRDRLYGPVIDHELESTRQAWNEASAVEHASVKYHLKQYLPAGMTVEDVLPYFDHSQRDKIGSHALWEAALEAATGKSLEHLVDDRNRAVLASGDVNSEYWADAYIAWQQDSGSSSMGRRDQIRAKFGDKATDIENWLYRNQKPQAAKQRDAMIADLQKHFEKQGKAQKFTHGSPFLDRDEITKEHLVLNFASKKEMMAEVKAIAEEGNFKEFQVHQYKPTTARHKGYVVITPIRASLEELIDLF